MRLHLWGTDFRRSSPEMRAKLFAAPEAREKVVRDLMSLGFHDLVYLCTCNRVEFFTTGEDHFRDTRPLWLALLNYFHLSEEDFYRGYHLEGKSAVRHLLRVASSLESLVVGEPQILGQLKDALASSKQWGVAIDRSLERSFNLAFETAKKVRSSTAIGEKPVSVATLGLKHLQSHENEFPLRKAVVVGRGPISLLTVQWLRKNRPQCPILWVNRTPEAVLSLPESEGTEVMSLARFLQETPDFSHLFTATASSEVIFDRAFFSRWQSAPAMLFDFAQPPDIEREAVTPVVGKLLHLEDLMEEARENGASRTRAIREAETIIETALRDHVREQKEAPVLRDFNRIEPHLWDDLGSALVMLEAEFPPEIQPKLRKWAEKLLKKNLHESREHLRSCLRKEADPEESYPVI